MEEKRGYAHVHYCASCDSRYLCAGDVCEVEEMWFGKDRYCQKCFMNMWKESPQID